MKNDRIHRFDHKIRKNRIIIMSEEFIDYCPEVLSDIESSDLEDVTLVVKTKKKRVVLKPKLAPGVKRTPKPAKKRGRKLTPVNTEVIASTLEFLTLPPKGSLPAKVLV